MVNPLQLGIQMLRMRNRSLYSKKTVNHNTSNPYSGKNKSFHKVENDPLGLKSAIIYEKNRKIRYTLHVSCVSFAYESIIHLSLYKKTNHNKLKFLVQRLVR